MHKDTCLKHRLCIPFHHGNESELVGLVGWNEHHFLLLILLLRKSPLTQIMVSYSVPLIRGHKFLYTL